jgi:hypothetical protein
MYRVYKEQTELTTFDKKQLDIVREYNYLVESNLKQTPSCGLRRNAE